MASPVHRIRWRLSTAMKKKTILKRCLCLQLLRHVLCFALFKTYIHMWYPNWCISALKIKEWYILNVEFSVIKTNKHCDGDWTFWPVTVRKAEVLLITLTMTPFFYSKCHSKTMWQWRSDLFHYLTPTLACPNIFCKKGLLFATQLSSSLIVILQNTPTRITFSKTYLFSIWLCLSIFGWQCLSCVCH